MDKKTTRIQRTAERLTRALHEAKIERAELQTQSYKTVEPSETELRISTELYNLRCNAGEIQKTECIF